MERHGKVLVRRRKGRKREGGNMCISVKAQPKVLFFS